MAEKTVSILQQQTKPITITKWKIQQGVSVSIGRPLLLYKFSDDPKSEQRKLKSTHAGTVCKIVAKEGVSMNPGDVLLQLEACCHPTIMNDMCAECGADLRKDDVICTASVPMVHAIPDLKVSEEVAQKLGKADNERLIRDHKLVLLVDLDQTLIHTTNDNIPPNIKEVYHFQLYGPNSPWYHTRLRPGTHQFLNNIYDYYELHICTFGARNYAHMIAMFLDANQKIFSNRILSRDECFDPTSKKANLKALFPCGDNMVCIIDDREDVWSHASNLIHVKPYHFFQHTGDINAPPGLDKQENDSEAGIDFNNIVENNANNVKKKEEKKVEIRNDKKKAVVEDNKKEGVVEDDKKKEVKIDGDEEKGNVENDEKKNITGDNVKEVVEEVTKKSKVEDGEAKKIVVEDEKNVNEGDNETKKDKQICEQKNGQEIVDNEVNGDGNESTNEKISKADVIGDKAQVELSNSNENSKNSKLKLDENVKNNKTKQEIEKSTIKSSENKETQLGPKQNSDSNFIEVEDPDDYLIYLEDILKRIHKEFYDEFDRMESGEIPDLKQVIPRVRSSVLKGCRLVFSGLVPTHIKLEQSKAYQVARSLGATVTQNIDDQTTHLVAVRLGTAKVNAGRRKKNLKIVIPEWLWCCAERWEHVDERIFPLKGKGSKNRHPPPHCSSPEHIPTYPVHNMPASRKRTPSGRFMDTINPLMSFSSDDIADMDKEVEDILDDDSDSSEEEFKTLETAHENIVKAMDVNDSSSEEESAQEKDYPKGFKRKREESDEDEGVENQYPEDSSEDETLNVKFRRGESIEDVLDMEQDETQDSEGSIDPPDEVDDGEWNMMGAALEREFLANN